MSYEIADSPVVMGTGLLAMDILLAGGPPSVAAGGTCGNVLTILSWMGWSALPVARLNGDPAGKVVREDLRRFGVRLDLAEQAPAKPTPVIIERLRRGANGDGVHRFSVSCPTCRAWLPRYQPVPSGAVRKLLDEISPPQVFFFDRLSRGALLLAEWTAESGGLVWFEPSRLADYRLFDEVLAVTHVLKYSRERLPELASRPVRADGPLLEIETAGAEGLRYRAGGPDEERPWCPLPAVPTPSVVDTAGAGDWFSASMIHEIGPDARAALSLLVGRGATGLAQSIRRAQASSSVACGYAGARGAMYALTPDRFIEERERCIDSRCSAAVDSVLLAVPAAGDWFCRTCQTPVAAWS